MVNHCQPFCLTFIKFFDIIFYMNYRENYDKYLASPEWAEKRKQKALESNFMCEICGRVIPKGFHIHHKTYIHFGNEPLSDLQFLCEECHMNLHAGITKKKVNLKKSKKNRRNCSNCYYSQIMKYKGTKTSRRVLWCNQYCKECQMTSYCTKYRKGIEKTIKTKINKNKKSKKANKKRVEFNLLSKPYRKIRYGNPTHP